jgi:hypothetical protein
MGEKKQVCILPERQVQLHHLSNQMAYSTQNHLMLPIIFMIASLAKWAKLNKKYKQLTVSHRIHA